MSQKLFLPSRDLLPFILQDLKEKMVFIGGPRQVGKTTLAKTILENERKSGTIAGYFNWDDSEHRADIRQKNWPKSQKIIILDEVHKSKNWRNMVKGFYDTQKNTHSFLVTGSARLDHYRKGGDSLLGRYHYYRLHPYSLTELIQNPPLNKPELAIAKLFKFGGFPEPLASQNERALRRWHLMRIERLIKTDLRDLENVKDLNKMEILAQTLPERIGSPLSVKNLAEDLEIDPKTCKKWIEHLESLYFCFLISPYGAPKIKAVKKEKKLYLWDWSQNEDEGSRFENMVASHLLKYCHFHQDTDGYPMELRYLRDHEKREIDFIVLKNKKPIFAVECKLKQQPVQESLYYFEKKIPQIPFRQVYLYKDSKLRKHDHTRSISFYELVQEFKLV